MGDPPAPPLSGRLYRITDRMPDGEVDIEPSMNVAAFYFVEALAHLANPCDECGRPGAAQPILCR